MDVLDEKVVREFQPRLEVILKVFGEGKIKV
jgi:hypothetical protein